jgi:HD-like signal output (HDOD) protein
MTVAPKSAPAGNPGEGQSDVAFHFVQALASELSTGKIELPGFPHIVMRVQKILGDEKSDANRIVKVLGSEPVLASQIIRVANSAAINPGGVPCSDLRSAVARVGLDTVRSATISFAMHQLRNAPLLKGLETPLGVLWRRSVQVASLCCVLARRLTPVNPDTALLAGLLQGIGRLYILTRASSHRALFADQDSYHAIEQDWHLAIAAALLESWGISDEIVQAIHESESPDRDCRGPTNLTDVLVAGTLLAEHHGEPKALAAQVQIARPLQKLKLDAAACQAFITESAADIESLREALG